MNGGQEEEQEGKRGRTSHTEENSNPMQPSTSHSIGVSLGVLPTAAPSALLLVLSEALSPPSGESLQAKPQGVQLHHTHPHTYY